MEELKQLVTDISINVSIRSYCKYVHIILALFPKCIFYVICENGFQLWVALLRGLNDLAARGHLYVSDFRRISFFSPSPPRICGHRSMRSDQCS